MNSISDSWGLPDPVTQAEFYTDVTFKRLIAFIVDSLLILLISVAIVPFTAFTAVFFFPVLGFFVSLIYRSVSLANSSATPGMRLMGIEFRTINGERMTLGLAVAHTVIFMVSLSMVVPQVISIILMLTGTRGQSLGDLMLGVAAINRAARS